MGYWQDRQAATMANLTNKGIAETEKQLKSYYRKTMSNVIGRFEETYNKVLLSIEDGKQPTPADLYKLNTYWEQQAQLAKELTKLGDYQAKVLSEKFMEEWHNIYGAIAAKDDLFFSQVSYDSAQEMINQIWCADGKSWSERVWQNTSLLQQELNDNLMDCLIAGRKTGELKQRLQERFNVSYHRAETIVRTEMAHIQTQAARQRYEDAGLSEVEVWADKDERRCDVCGELHQKRFPVGGRMPIPAHPNCRCCIIPVIQKENLTNSEMNDIYIGKSLGAAAKNYPVKDIGDSKQRFKFAEGTVITKIKVIMGKGTDKPLNEKYKIAARNGIKNPDNIQKLRGEGYVIANRQKRKAELHWYEAEEKKFEFKVKRYFDES